MSGLESSHVLVLAAGRGTRMGGPKAMMGVGGRAWWMIQRERLATLGMPVTWVVSSAVRSAMLCSGTPPESIVLADPEAPMFSSLLEGIDSLRARPPRSVFVLPIDCPAPGPGVWRELAATGDVAVPACGGRAGHPVHLPWTFVTSIPDFAAAAATEASPARLDHLIGPVAKLIKVRDPAVTTNLNTPRDLQAWLNDQQLR